jgi:hypothetical protein
VYNILMTPHRLNILTSISGFLSVALFAFWIAGLMQIQLLSEWGITGRYVGLFADFWVAGVNITRPLPGPMPPRPYGELPNVFHNFPEISFDVAGFRLWRGQSYAGGLGNYHITSIMIPALPICVLTAILPTIQLVKRLRRKHRVDPTICSKCGYDLRATKDRCPECGTQTPTAIAVYQE